MNNKKLVSTFITLTLILSLFSISIFAQQETGNNQQNQEKEVVATIEDQEIYMRELEQQAGLQQIFMQLQQQSPEFVRSLTTTEKGQAFLNQYKSDFLDNLIDQKVLEREIKQQNIELTQKEKDEFFNKQLERIKQQQDMSEEEILEALKQQGIESMDQFKEQFLAQQESNLKIQKLIDNVDIEVSDAEAKENYEQNQYRQKFEQVKEQIKNQIAREKYIESLKEELDIDKKL